jgi:hypothetical protein
MVSEAAPLIDAAQRLIDAALRRDVIGTAERTARDVAAARRLQTETLALQRQVAEMQRRALSAQLAGLRIQRASLRHIQNIDRKTGGSVPTLP